MTNKLPTTAPNSFSLIINASGSSVGGSGGSTCGTLISNTPPVTEEEEEKKYRVSGALSGTV